MPSESLWGKIEQRDITPVSYRAQTLSWMEAVVGVTFMATAIALLVSQMVAGRRAGRDA